MKAERRRIRPLFPGRAVLVASLAAVVSLASIRGQEAFSGRPLQKPEGFELVKLVSAPGSAPWTDTGIEVKGGDAFFFEATGRVSLQKDNPVAACGPEGLKLQTVQQPLADRNLGSLIGKVRIRVEVVEDKQTGEKFERDFGEIFYIGEGALVFMPADGRLMLGVNENVAGDNEGAFAVTIYRKSPD
jgi:hypothetical protein